MNRINTYLVTGGLGYIGSHTIVELAKKECKIVITDNLVNCDITVLDKLKSITKTEIDFYKYDVTNEEEMDELYNKYSFDGIFHFAGLKAVGESVEKPIEYYTNNVIGTLVLAKLAVKHNVNKFIFSSSATVYGDNVSPLHEEMTLKLTTNPYGETKAMSERILKDTAKSNENFNVTLLRYFNPVGAHENGLIGENPKGIPNNLMPYVTRVAKKDLKQLSIFGNDYPTPDGTGVRDYIHVVDLAKGHVAALEHMKKGTNIYNLGTGMGISVLELVEKFKEVNNIDVPYVITERRAGDVASVYANADLAKKDLKWETHLTLEDMVRDSWNFEKNNSN